MKPIICVTGTPGTGKTLFAKKLCTRKKLSYVDVTALIARERLYTHYDRKLHTRVVHMRKLIDMLTSFITAAHKTQTGLVIDSHLSHYVPHTLVDTCFVVTCPLPVLKRRLTQRKYSAHKIRENLDAEIMQVCYLEALANKHHVALVRGESLRT